MPNKKTKASLLMIATAISLISLMTIQPVACYWGQQIYVPELNSDPVIGPAISAVNWILSIFAPPPAGVTADSHLSLFYNSKNNEFMSATVGMNDEASSINGTGYFLGRVAEYTAMSFLNNTLYPTFPRWTIENATVGMVNQSISMECSNTIEIWGSVYTSALNDAITYATASFTGSLSGLSLKLDSTNVNTLSGHQFEVMYGFSKAWTSPSSYANDSFGYLIVNGSATVVYQWNNNAPSSHLYFEDQLKTNNTDIVGTDTSIHKITLTTGIYKVNDLGWHGGATIQFLTDGALIEVPSGALPENVTKIVDLTPTNPVLYDSLVFGDTSAHTYTISMSNKTTMNLWNIQQSLDGAQHFAMALAQTYWTTLRNAGIYDQSQIPLNQVIPPPDIAFMTNTDLANLTPEEITAFYLAYLHSLANFFNSTTYTTISNFAVANVTFANEAVIINASLLNNAKNITWTTGDLYVQVYADMNLTDGLVLLNSTGILYNLNDTPVSCWRYDSGNYLNISHIYVKDSVTGSYVEVNATTITATSISGYIYTSNSGPPAVPAGPAASSGGGGIGTLLIIAAIVVIGIAALRSRAESKGGGGVVIIGR